METNPEITGLSVASLIHTEFFDGIRMLGGGTEGHSFFYKFGIATYEISVYSHYQTPYSKYIIESGDYILENLNLTLFPHIRIDCKIEYINIGFPCANVRQYTDLYYLNKDTINDENLAKYGFLPRSIEVSRKNEKMIFRDEGISRFVIFEELRK
jgi:hypothetical protein